MEKMRANCLFCYLGHVHILKSCQKCRVSWRKFQFCCLVRTRSTESTHNHRNSITSRKHYMLKLKDAARFNFIIRFKTRSLSYAMCNAILQYVWPLLRPIWSLQDHEERNEDRILKSTTVSIFAVLIIYPLRLREIGPDFHFHTMPTSIYNFAVT